MTKFQDIAGAVRSRSFFGRAGDKVIKAVKNGELASGATLTRADPAKYFDSEGIMQTAAANEARTTYIGGNPYLWIDGEVTEISGWSYDLDNWTGITAATANKDVVGLDGEDNSGFRVSDTSDSARRYRTNQTTITSGSSTYYAVIAAGYESAPSVYPELGIDLIGGTVIRERFVLDKSGGSYTVRFTDGAVVLDPIRFNDMWLMVLSLTDNASGNNQLDQVIAPAFNDDGSAVGGKVIGDTNIGVFAVFKDSFSLMPILTTGGTTKTVAADVASLTNSIISGLTKGVLFAEIWVPQLTSNASRTIAKLETDANNFIDLFHETDGDLDAQITDGGASQATLNGTDLTVGTLQKVALAFDGSDYALYRDGTQETTASSGTMPSVDTLLIGENLFGGIKTLNVYTTRLSNAQLASMTT